MNIRQIIATGILCALLWLLIVLPPKTADGLMGAELKGKTYFWFNRTYWNKWARLSVVDEDRRFCYGTTILISGVLAIFLLGISRKKR